MFLSIKSQGKTMKPPYSYIRRKLHCFAINTFIYVIAWILQPKKESSTPNPYGIQREENTGRIGDFLATMVRLRKKGK